METTRSGRIVVGVSATYAGFQAIRYAVAEARRSGRPVVAVRAHRGAEIGAVGALSPAIADAGTEEIARTFIEALGQLPADVDVTAVVRLGTPGRTLVAMADRPDDLIVIGGSGPWRWTGRRSAAVARECSRSATCPVVIVPPPALARTTSERRLAHDAASGIKAFLVEQRSPGAL